MNGGSNPEAEDVTANATIASGAGQKPPVSICRAASPSQSFGLSAAEKTAELLLHEMRWGKNSLFYLSTKTRVTAA